MRTPLHWAASNGTASCVRALVAAGADMMGGCEISVCVCECVLLSHTHTVTVVERIVSARIHCKTNHKQKSIYQRCSSLPPLPAQTLPYTAKNADGETPLEVANYWNNPESAPALRQLMGFSKRIGVKCEGFNMGVQEHYSVQRVGVRFPLFFLCESRIYTYREPIRVLRPGSGVLLCFRVCVTHSSTHLHVCVLRHVCYANKIIDTWKMSCRFFRILSAGDRKRTRSLRRRMGGPGSGCVHTPRGRGRAPTNEILSRTRKFSFEVLFLTEDLKILFSLPRVHWAA